MAVKLDLTVVRNVACTSLGIEEFAVIECEDKGAFTAACGWCLSYLTLRVILSVCEHNKLEKVAYSFNVALAGTTGHILSIESKSLTAVVG